MVFSTSRIEGEDRLDISDVEIANGMHARADRLALDARMADVRATQLLAALPGGGTEFLLRIKFLQQKAEDDWVFEDKFDPVQAERKKGRGVVEVARNTSPGVLTGIDSVFYQNTYPYTAVVYGLYPVRDPEGGGGGGGKTHASDRALPYQKPPRLHPDPSSGQRNAGQGRPGQGLSKLLPMERPNGLDA